MIDVPFDTLDEWIAYFSQAQLPILRRTAKELDDLRDSANRVNGRVLSSIILQDPLLTLRVLAYIEQHRSKSQNADITTIERALMMIGMEPFFREFHDLPLMEGHLKGHPKALVGILKVIARARRAAHWARDWAVLRHDLDVDEITVATLLYEVAEILMWCFAPNLALKVREQHINDRHLRSVIAQEQVFHIRLHMLQLSLAKAWRLPPLLTTLMDREHADHPRVRNVTLAVDMARHAGDGWDDPALPDDFRAVQNLVHISHEQLAHRLGIDPLPELLVAEQEAPKEASPPPPGNPPD